MSEPTDKDDVEEVKLLRQQEKVQSFVYAIAKWLQHEDDDKQQEGGGE